MSTTIESVEMRVRVFMNKGRLDEGLARLANINLPAIRQSPEYSEIEKVQLAERELSARKAKAVEAFTNSLLHDWSAVQIKEAFDGLPVIKP